MCTKVIKCKKHILQYAVTTFTPLTHLNLCQHADTNAFTYTARKPNQVSERWQLRRSSSSSSGVSTLPKPLEGTAMATRSLRQQTQAIAYIYVDDACMDFLGFVNHSILLFGWEPYYIVQCACTKGSQQMSCAQVRSREPVIK